MLERGLLYRALAEDSQHSLHLADVPRLEPSAILHELGCFEYRHVELGLKLFVRQIAHDEASVQSPWVGARGVDLSLPKFGSRVCVESRREPTWCTLLSSAALTSVSMFEVPRTSSSSSCSAASFAIRSSMVFCMPAFNVFLRLFCNSVARMAPASAARSCPPGSTIAKPRFEACA